MGSRKTNEVYNILKLELRLKISYDVFSKFIFVTYLN